MTYKAIVLIAGATLFRCACPLLADDSSKFAKAEELIQLTQGDQMMKMVEPMMKSMAAMGAPNISAEDRAKITEGQQKIMAMVMERIKEAKPLLAKIYADTFTEEELDAILGFYKSPAGQSFMAKLPDIMQRTTPVMMTIVGGLQPEIKKMAEDLKNSTK